MKEYKPVESNFGPKSDLPTGFKEVFLQALTQWFGDETDCCTLNRIYCSQAWGLNISALMNRVPDQSSSARPSAAEDTEVIAFVSLNLQLNTLLSGYALSK